MTNSNTQLQAKIPAHMTGIPCTGNYVQTIRVFALTCNIIAITPLQYGI